MPIHSVRIAGNQQVIHLDKAGFRKNNVDPPMRLRRSRGRSDSTPPAYPPSRFSMIAHTAGSHPFHSATALLPR